MKWRKLEKAKADLQKFDDNLSWETLKKWATEIKPIIRHFFSEDLEEFNTLMEEPHRRSGLPIGCSLRINYPLDDILLYFASDREPEPNHKDEEARQLEWEKESDKKYQQEVVKRKEEFLTFLNHLLMLEEVYESDKKNNKQENDSTKNEVHFHAPVNVEGNIDIGNIEENRYNIQGISKEEVLNMIVQIIKNDPEDQVLKFVQEHGNGINERQDISKDEIVDAIKDLKDQIKTEPEKQRLHRILEQLTIGAYGSMLAPIIIQGLHELIKFF